MLDVIVARRSVLHGIIEMYIFTALIDASYSKRKQHADLETHYADSEKIRSPKDAENVHIARDGCLEVMTV